MISSFILSRNHSTSRKHRNILFITNNINKLITYNNYCCTNILNLCSVENVLWRSYACRDYRLVGFTGDICPKNARKRYNVTILELNPVVGRDDVVVDHCRRRESSTSSGGVNDGLQSSCSECTDRSYNEIIYTAPKYLYIFIIDMYIHVKLWTLNP